MLKPPARFPLRSALWFLPLVLLCAAVASASAPDAANPEEVPADDGFVAPQIILSTQKQPVYPPAALKARYTGSVLVEMTVLVDGKVGKIKVVECSRPKVGFEDAAMTALKQWRFKPGYQDGVPIEVNTRLKLNFDRLGVGLDGDITAGAFASTSSDGSASSPGTSSK